MLRLVSDLGAIFHVHAAYAPGHPLTRTAVDRVLAAFGEWCAHTRLPEASLLLVEGHLLVDRQPVPDDAKWATGLCRAFDRHGIGGMTLLAGLDGPELLGFLDACNSPAGAVSTAHILVGRAGFAGAGTAEGGALGTSSGGTGPGPVPEGTEGARAEFLGAGRVGVARIDRLRTLVARLARGAGPTAVDPADLAAARVSDRHFLHGLGVAIATARLGRALRLEGRALEELTLAGFLHDVGHLEAVAGESPALTRELHTARGAARLASIEGVPDVAVLVAFEHHLRIDGVPDEGGSAGAVRLPGAAARVVAVADTWETFRAQPEGGKAAALVALHVRAGTFLDPSLVEVFARLRIARPVEAGKPPA
jgi:hypothetical protein